MVGKWDAGMATPDHTPLGRGYESWLGYYQHANGYWRKDTTLQATGEVDLCLDRMRDLSFHNATYRGPMLDAASMSDSCKADPDSDPACYEEHLFKQRGLQVIQEHDPSEPLFLFYAFHLLHTPLQVPMAYLRRVDQLLVKEGAKPFDSSNRRLLSAMLLYMDDVVGELVEALKAKKLWDNTLLIMMGDNGGAVYEPGAGNNHPLRGAKYNDFDGGVRVNAFLSGGFVPQAKRGTGFNGVISVADWYGTLSQLAGVDFEDQRAKAANEWLSEKGLPLLAPVDSVQQWDFILNGSNGRPDVLHLSDQAVLRWPYKLVTGGQPYGGWTGSLYPNCSTAESYRADHGPMFVDIKLFDTNVRSAYRKSKHDELLWWHDCEEGCLFDLQADPTESHDLAAEPAMQQVKASLLAQLGELNKRLFLPERGDASAAACKGAVDHGGVLGPFVDAEEWYSPMPKPSLMERLKRSAEKRLFDTVSQDAVRTAVHKFGPDGYPFVRGFLAKAMDLDQCLPDSELLV
jgi:arylsulfatase I/J